MDASRHISHKQTRQSIQDALETAAGFIIEERMIGRRILQSPVPATSDDMNAFKSASAHTDTAFNAALTQFTDVYPSGYAQDIKALRRKHRILRDNRKRVTSDAAKLLPARSGNTAREWPHVPADMVHMLHELSGDNASPGYARNMIRVLGDDIAALVSEGAPIGRVQAERLGRDAGAIDYAVRHASLATDPQSFRLLYEGNFRIAYEHIITQGKTGEDYTTPVTVLRRTFSEIDAAMATHVTARRNHLHATLSEQHTLHLMYIWAALLCKIAGLYAGAKIRSHISADTLSAQRKPSVDDMLSIAERLEGTAQALLQHHRVPPPETTQLTAATHR